MGLPVKPFGKKGQDMDRKGKKQKNKTLILTRVLTQSELARSARLEQIQIQIQWNGNNDNFPQKKNCPNYVLLILRNFTLFTYHK